MRLQWALIFSAVLGGEKFKPGTLQTQKSSNQGKQNGDSIDSGVSNTGKAKVVAKIAKENGEVDEEGAEELKKEMENEPTPSLNKIVKEKIIEKNKKEADEKAKTDDTTSDTSSSDSSSSETPTTDESNSTENTNDASTPNTEDGDTEVEVQTGAEAANAEVESASIMSQFKSKLADQQARWKAQDPDGENAQLAKDQNAANKERMQATSDKAIAAANEMQSKMQVKRDEFGQVIEQQADQYKADTEKLLGKLTTGISGMEIDMEPGKGIVGGDFIELSGWEMDMGREVKAECIANCDGSSGGSDDIVSSSDSMLDLMIGECYKGIKEGDKALVDKNCATADIATYRCRTPIDASFYIGVSFDITKSLDPSSFRSKLVKHWCRDRQTYKGQYDVPDGMHIQGVYETSVVTEVHSSDLARIQAEAALSTSLSGNAVFSEEQESASEAKSSTMTGSGGVSGSQGGVSGGANAQTESSSGSSSGDSAFATSSKNDKIQNIKNSRNNTKTTGDEMVATMKVNVIRYEMFLREVGPKFIHEDFLDCFMMLPNSFYAPKSPEKFMDFITRYGTHYLKAAKFGGQLEIVKKKRKIQGMTISDMRSEAQEEMDAIVGNAVTKEKVEVPETSGTSFGGIAEGGGMKIGLSISKGKTEEKESSFSSNNGTAEVDEAQEAANIIARNRFRKSSTTTKVIAIGGTHKIATTITDLYSTNFRTNLVRWLDSIPRYPKPFEPVFEEISELMVHLIDDMIDQTCYSACIIEKQDNCLKERTHTIGCDTVFAGNSPTCQVQCKEASECTLSAPRIIDCYEIVEQKARMQRKVDSLRTAINLYINTGTLYSPTHYTIPAEPEGCTTSYRAINPDDEFDFEFGESEAENWSIISQGYIEVQFSMKQHYFNQEGLLSIHNHGNFYIFFDESDRRWYTMDDLKQPRLSQSASPPVSFNDIVRIESEEEDGAFVSIPATVQDGDEQFVMFRLRHGLWLEINLQNGDVVFSSRCLDAMQRSQNEEVREFLAAYETSVLTQMAAGSGQSLGFINPIVQNTGLAPFPCEAQWSESQMFDSTDDLQQCVKITLETTEEYFFIVANSIEDKSSWIYVHQTLDTLCLYKLDHTLKNNDVEECATKYGKMSTGTIPNMVEQLYFCVYQKGDLLSISLSRPSLNRQDSESAITILTHNLIKNADGSGKLIFPRYYAVAAGSSPVFVRSTFITEIESLECRKPFIKETFGGSFKCALRCDAQCSDYGCMSQEDPTKCYTCKNSKLIIERQDRDEIVICVDSCTNANGEYRVGNEVIRTYIYGIPNVDLKDRDGQVVCKNCHEECFGACDGFTQFDCIKTSRRCRNFEQATGPTTNECLGSCPDKTFEFTNTSDSIDYCEHCADECAKCDSTDLHTFAGDTAQYKKCLTCAPDHLKVTIDIDYYACVPNKNDGAECPAGFVRHGDECHKSWRPIGYQNVQYGSALTANCRTDECNVDVDGNFLNLGDHDTFKIRFSSSETIDGVTLVWYNFQLAWKVDACTVVVLEWRQQNNPLDTQATLSDTTVEIFSFKQLKCNVNDPNLANLKKISFANANFFTNCPDIQLTKYNSTNLGFLGLKLDSTSTTNMLKGSNEGLFNFGYLKLPDTGVISAFKIDKSVFFSSELQLSVNDQREKPIGWSAWDPKKGSVDEICSRDCATGESTVIRERFCRCVEKDGTVEINDKDNKAEFNKNCQPCIGERKVTANCDMSSCELTNTATNPGVTVNEIDEYYHHSCCEGSTALRVIGLDNDAHDLGYNGIYELVYDTTETNHVYKILHDSFELTIEYVSADKNWKIKGGTETLVSGVRADGTFLASKCPINAGGWFKSSDTTVKVDLAVTCSTGRNTCPWAHPYSFEKGKKCCSSPFHNDGSAHSILTPDHVSQTNNGSSPHGQDANGNDEIKYIAEHTGCVGTWVHCPIYLTTTTDRCRSNLTNPGVFKATQSKNYKYTYKLCPNLCYEVYAVSDPET